MPEYGRSQTPVYLGTYPSNKYRAMQVTTLRIARHKDNLDLERGAIYEPLLLSNFSDLSDIMSRLSEFRYSTIPFCRPL